VTPPPNISFARANRRDLKPYGSGGINPIPNKVWDGLKASATK